MPWTPPPPPSPPPAGPPWQGYTPPPAPGPAARLPLAVSVCLTLGFVLIVTAGILHKVGGDSAVRSGDSPAQAFTDARALWHSLPVDDLFPRTVKSGGAGPGDADRTWTRVGVAPDSGCDGAFDPALAKALAPAGCVRLLRATYSDATSTDVTTVGLLVGSADPAAMTALDKRWTAEHLAAKSDMLPRTVAFPGTDSAAFGPAQRGSWTVSVSSTLPIVVYAVSGFADGRAITTPQPAAAATVAGATSVPAQAGLGFEADGLAKAVGDRFVAAVRNALHPAAHDGATP